MEGLQGRLGLDEDGDGNERDAGGGDGPANAHRRVAVAWNPVGEAGVRVDEGAGDRGQQLAGLELEGLGPVEPGGEQPRVGRARSLGGGDRDRGDVEGVRGDGAGELCGGADRAHRERGEHGRLGAGDATGAHECERVGVLVLGDALPGAAHRGAHPAPEHRGALGGAAAVAEKRLGVGHRGDGAGDEDRPVGVVVDGLLVAETPGVGGLGNRLGDERERRRCGGRVGADDNDAVDVDVLEMDVGHEVWLLWVWVVETVLRACRPWRASRGSFEGAGASRWVNARVRTRDTSSVFPRTTPLTPGTAQHHNRREDAAVRGAHAGLIGAGPRRCASRELRGRRRAGRR